MNIDRHELDAVFDALANHHRREIVHLLGLQPCSISYLAQVRNLSLPAIHKHIKILEAAGMVTRRKVRQTNVLTLNRQSLRVLQDWVGQYHPYWGSEKETLENYAHYLGKQRNDNSEETP